MKNSFLYLVKIYLKIGLFFYYRRIESVGKENIPKHKALMVLGNHQNALIDPLLLAKDLDTYAYYLTRAGVFKNKYVGRLLSLFNMLPIYRIRDGWTTLTKNNEIFLKSKNILKNKNTLVIFPEGSHSLVRRVRPLSKGFTRIIFNTLETYPDLDLQLLPVGFNYQNAVDFPDSVSVYYGAPVSIKPFLEKSNDRQVNLLKSTIHEALTGLTTHLPEKNYDEVLNKLDSLRVDYTKPMHVASCISKDFVECIKKRPKTSFNKILKPLVYLNLVAPILFWRLYVKPKIKELEFMSTFRFAVSIILIPVWLLSITLLLQANLGFTIAISYLFLSLGFMLLYVKA